MTKDLSLSTFVLAVVFLLAGCATAERRVETVEQVRMEDMLASAGAASAAGKSDQAMVILREAAGAYPAEKEPWRQIAQMHFDAANYGQAILGAQEVLQRDPNDQLASSIVAVSGLRLSTKALADLSRQNNLSGSLRAEAQSLAKLLRETLGEPIFVPSRPRAAVSPKPSPSVVAKPASRSAVRPAPAPAAQSSANPFGSLK